MHARKGHLRRHSDLHACIYGSVLLWVHITQNMIHRSCLWDVSLRSLHDFDLHGQQRVLTTKKADSEETPPWKGGKGGGKKEGASGAMTTKRKKERKKQTKKETVQGELGTYARSLPCQTDFSYSCLFACVFCLFIRMPVFAFSWLRLRLSLFFE